MVSELRLLIYSVTERRGWRPPYQMGKTVHVHAKNTTNTLRTDAQHPVCFAMLSHLGGGGGNLGTRIGFDTHTTIYMY